MARRKNGLVEVFRHRGFDVEITLDRGTGQFHAELPVALDSRDEMGPNTTYGFHDGHEDATLEGIRRKLREAVDARMDAAFAPVIYVLPPSDNDDGLRLRYHRVFEARVGDRVLQREFIAKGAVKEGFLPDEADGSPGDYTYRPNSESYTALPYTHERWAALRRLTAMMEELRLKIAAELAAPARLDALLGRVNQGASLRLGLQGNGEHGTPVKRRTKQRRMP